MIDLSAPITPGESLGGLKIGQPIVQLEDKIKSLWLDGHQGTVYPVSWKDLNYVVTPEITVGVNVFTGRISKLIAKPGYSGLFGGKISIGMTCFQAKCLLPALYYDNILSVLKVEGHKGICLQVEDEDPLEDRMWTSPIAYITVMDEDELYP